MTVRPMDQNDYPVVHSIYELGIATGNATFQTEAPPWETWDKDHLKKCRLVAVDNSMKVIGWAALTPVSGRCVYAGVAEVSVYVHPDARGTGVGNKILEALIRESEDENIWTLQAGIFPENKASLKLHAACGFRQIGYREKIGKMNGAWRDTILLERRSKRVGT
jgi:L-amino acid N-acyltransferase YncA